MQIRHDVILDTLNGQLKMYYANGNDKLEHCANAGRCQIRACIVDDVTVQCIHD